MKIEGDTITFSSGATAYANCGIVGLGPDMAVTEGYDGGIWQPDDAGDSTLSANDLRELADYMIGQWTRFKSTLKPQ